MKSFFDKTLAIVVLYKETVETSTTILSITKAIPKNQVLDVLVYDNSPIASVPKQRNIENINFFYFHDQSNSGVSAAYNYGANFANKLNKSWLLILDQDTIFNNNIFERYYEAIEKNKNIYLFAPILKIDTGLILSPCSFKFYGKHLRNIKPGVNLLKNNSPINSGILVKVSEFQNVGGYNEKVPLDISDHQFIENYRRNNEYYFVIDSVGFQNFSAIEDNLEKQLVRFKYYSIGIFNFNTDYTLKKERMIFFLMLKAMKNSLKHRSLGFMKIYLSEWNSYILQGK